MPTSTPASPHKPTHRPTAAYLAGLANQLEAIVANENPEQAKELLRLLIKDIQVHDRRRIIPTYRIPAAVRAIPRKVGGTGLEPVTPSLSAQQPITARIRVASATRSAFCSALSSFVGKSSTATVNRLSALQASCGCFCRSAFAAVCRFAANGS